MKTTADKLKTIREAIDAFDELVAMTYDPNDHDEPHPDYSAADVFEEVCNLGQHVYEAYRAITTIEPQPPVNAQVLKAMLDLLAIAEQGDPADEEERTTLEAARAAARAAKTEACEPCPLCASAEQLCEACGGHGVVPKTIEPTKIVVSVSGGIASAVYCTDANATAQVVDFDDLHAEDLDDDGCDKVLDEATAGMACIY